MKITYIDKIIHEMNNPIQVIYLLSDLMLNDKTRFSEADTKENLRHIYEASQKLMDITNMLAAATNMTATDITSDKVIIRTEKLDLIKLVEQETKYHQIQNKGNKHLKIALANKIPSIAAKADKFWLKQLLSNLIINAINHSEKGVIKVSTDLVKKDKIHYFHLQVSDKGSGIPEDELETIFMPLQRGSHSIGKIDGSGIGLTVAKEIAEAHGGTITARNNPKGGATFEVVIPV